MITINYDFTTGKEVSYVEGINLGDNFETNVLDFFSFDEPAEVKILKKNGNFILKSELLINSGKYTNKHIRESHNIHKMLKANSFKW